MKKTKLAEQLGISRSTLYYKPKQPEKDWILKKKIEETLHDYPSYGSPRIALHLERNEKAVARVMKLFGIKAYRRRPKSRWKKRDHNVPAAPYANILLTMFPSHPNTAWASDFTYINWRSKRIYLATIIDIYSRLIVRFNILNRHTLDLVTGALTDALRIATPLVLHSDQGSEYRSKPYTTFAGNLGIRISMSKKSSPWENGYQESFYSQFKVDLGDPNRFETLVELAAAIYATIFFYNHLRIHTAFKMPPAVFLQRYYERQSNLAIKGRSP